VFLLLDPRLEDEAVSLGADRAQLWLRILLPMLRRPVAEAFTLGFLVSWAQVPLTLVIGGGAVRTLPVEVLAFVRAGQDRYAATGALLLILPAAAAILLGLAARRSEAAPL
jgi:putative spermidine/putrescine transport system permease protein